MKSLKEMNCVPIKRDEPSLTEQEIQDLRTEVPAWNILEKDGPKRLEREFKFENFAKALAFTNKIGEIAEQQDHHPKLVTEWGKVTVTCWTHKIGGLHRNDFIIAAKTDEQYKAE